MTRVVGESRTQWKSWSLLGDGGAMKAQGQAVRMSTVGV